MISKKDIILIVPKYLSTNLSNERSHLTRSPHMGFGYISSYLKMNDISSIVVDMNLGYNNEELLSIINKYSPRLIGITIYSSGYINAYKLIDYLKDNTITKILVGGVHVSLVEDEVLKNSKADFACIGEGEEVFVELYNCLITNINDLSTIDGLIWKNKNIIISNNKRKLIQNLDNLPYPDYSGFELEKYFCFKDKRMSIITSRGCPFKCNFCCTWISMGRGFRKRSSSNVVNEIEYWYNKGWNVFDINDDIFSLDKKRIIDICEQITSKDMKISINMYVGLRVDTVDDEILSNLKTINCKFISYGCESGNNTILKDINKGITIEQVINANKLTNKYHIPHKFNFIIGHPTESFDDAMDSLKLAKKLKSSFVAFYNLIPYPNTAVYKEIINNPEVKFNCDYEEYLNYAIDKRNLPVFETKIFTTDQKKKALNICWDYEKKSLSIFRFGKLFGRMAYYTDKFESAKKIRLIFHEYFLSTKIGKYIYSKLINNPW